MRKSTRFLAIFLAVLMTVSVFPLSVFAATNVITAVDMTGYVTETVFPAGMVTTPVFYDTIPATVDGVKTNLSVDWECENYASANAGTYTFKAVADGYVWECEAPVITVSVVTAAYGKATSQMGIAPLGDNTTPVPLVIKGDSGNSANPNIMYDATGCNAFDEARTSSAMYLAGSHNSVSGANATSGTTRITVTDGAKVTSVYGGGYGGTMTHNGVTEVYINNATATNVYGGGFGANSTVTGNPIIDVSGNVTIGTIYGSGSHSNKVVGTTTVKIHNLAQGASVNSITRKQSGNATATSLVVELDDTSTRLFDNIVKDAATTIKINGETYVGMISVPEGFEPPVSVIVNKANETLVAPEGFSWEYDDTEVGSKEFKLVADTGYFLEGFVKSQTYTVEVTADTVEVTDVTIDQGDISVNVGETKTLTATVKPDHATDKSVMWSTEDTDIVEVNAVTGEVTGITVGEATVTATAGSVSADCKVEVKPTIAIKAVDTEGLVLNTAFAYSDNTNRNNRWGTTAYSEVAEPKFCLTIPVLLDGETQYTELEFDEWVCENYDSKTFATYEFTAKAPAGYVFEEGIAPVITVEVIDGGIANSASAVALYSFASAQDHGIHIVYKADSDGNNAFYDATGCNKLSTRTTGSGMVVAAGVLFDPSGIAGKTAFSGTTSGVNRVTVTDGAQFKALYGGNRKLAHDGDAIIDISGKVKISEGVYGGGYSADSSATVSGTTTVNIHNLEEGATIGTISRGTATNLEVRLDDTSKELIKKIVFDENTKVFINDAEIKIIESLDIEKTEYVVYSGTALEDIGLPTSFVIDGETVDGFTWLGDYNANSVGTYTLTLVAAENTYLAVEVPVTVQVIKDSVYKIQSVVSQSVKVNVPYGTSAGDVIPGLPTEFTAVLQNGSEITVPGSAFEWKSEDYTPDLPGDYTFKTALTDDDYVYLDGVAPYIATVTVDNPAVEGIVVTEIKIPVNYTVFTKDTGTVTVRDVNDGTKTHNEERKITFYDKLSAVAYENGVRREIEITGIEWEGVKVRTDANGEEWTYSIKSYDNDLELPRGVLDNATITAYKTSAEYVNSAGRLHGKGDIIVPTTVVKSDYEAYSGGYLGYDGMAVMDATGFNNVFKNIQISNAGTYHGGNSTDVTGNTSVTVENGAVVSGVYGGGYNASVTGNATINLKNGSTVNLNVYAGSNGDAFIGDSTINIENGAKVKGTVYAGSNNGRFDGNVVIDIADGAEITKISLGTVEENYPDSVSIYVTSNFDLSVIEGLDTGRINLYVDGERVYDVTNVEMPEVTIYNVTLGTETGNLPLPTTLRATIYNVESALENITWKCDNYNANVPGRYTFKPVIPANYKLFCETDHIEITVRVLSADAGDEVITGFNVINPISVTYGTGKEQIKLPERVKATVDGRTVEVEVDQWKCESYDGFVHGAEYTFTATVSGEYALAAAAPTVVVKITNAKIAEIYLPVTETTFPRGVIDNPVFYDTLTVKLDNGKVTELSGFEWTVKDYRKNSAGTYIASIRTVPANCEFAATLDVPEIKVTVSSHTYDVATTDTNIYLYGIPTVINGNENETYLYDMTGCNKMSPTNLVGKTIYGGGPAKTVALRTTMIEMRGGTVGTLYGGSKNNSKVTDTAYIYVLGGSLSQIYGGGNGGTSASTMATTQNTYVYVENAKVTLRATPAGYNGAVLDKATIVVKNATLNGIYGGSYSKDIGDVEGTSVIKLLDGATVTRIYGSGRVPFVNELEIYLSKNATVTTRLDPTGQSEVTGTAKIFYEKGFDLSKVYTEEENVKLYEGHFLEDRETFVTDREIKIVRNAGLVRGDFYVDYGTTLDNIGLPTSFEGEIEGELTTVSGITYTPVNNYNGNKAGRYEFKLSVPDGYNLPFTSMKNAGTITVVVEEPAQNGEITAIHGEDTGFTFANGTAIENIGLPTAYKATVSGVTKTVSVKDWNVTDENGRSVTYDRYKAGTYVFTPEFDSRYTVNSSVEMPVHTVKIMTERPYRLSGVIYLGGVSANLDSMIITDKNGNYLETAGTMASVYAGSANVDIDSTDITVNSGTVKTIFAGSRAHNVNNTRVVVNGGTVTNVIGGSYGGAPIDSCEIIINGGKITNVYSAYDGKINKGAYIEVNGGEITKCMAGSMDGCYIYGSPQEEREVLAENTINDKGPIVIEEGELISAVFVQNGGTIKTLFANGAKAGSRMMNSVKMYLNGGSAKMVYATGGNAKSVISENVYIVVSDRMECGTISANAPAVIMGKSYVVVPESYNRYNILGWDEFGEGEIGGSDSSEETNPDLEEDVVHTAEVIVSGGYHHEDMPVRVVYSNATQVVYANGTPIRIEGKYDADEDSAEEIDPTTIPTYISYFDVNYDETEEWEIFSYPTYVDAQGQQIELKGVWRQIETPLESGSKPTIYGGGMQGRTAKYPSTYVEFKGGYVASIYGGGKCNVEGAANVVLNAEGPYKVNGIYGGGNQAISITTNKVYVDVLAGSYSKIYAGGYAITNNGTYVNVEGGSVDNIFLGAYAASSVTGGEVRLDLRNCTVGNVYGGGYNSKSLTLGSAYINVYDNVEITGYVYPKGSGLTADKTTSGAVLKDAYVTLNDADKNVVSAQFKKIQYKAAQAPYIYVNGVELGEKPEVSQAGFTIAEKMIEVTAGTSTDDLNRAIIFLNGIPTVVAGDGAGHSYLYQAKTKDGTLNVYQKNEDGTFKLDENGNRISNIVRDSVTGQAIKGAKLVGMDVVDYVVYGGANSKSVEDVYVEFHNGGAVHTFYAGCRGGNSGYDEHGNEVGLVEVRTFDGGPWGDLYMGNTLGYDIAGNQSVNVKTTKNIFMGIGGQSFSLYLGGNGGVVGSEEKFIQGYYNKAGEVISYTDEDDGQVHTVTGMWEEYNLDLEKSDYTEYYNSADAYFKGSGLADFTETDYYVDPYDDHYTTYCVLANYSLTYLSAGTYGVQNDHKLNRVFGNTYVRRTAYGLKYDAELDMFVDDYNEYIGLDTYQKQMYIGSYTGAVYNDIRFDNEGTLTNGNVYPLGYTNLGAVNYGRTYFNLYETDKNTFYADELYNKLSVRNNEHLVVNKDFYPRWSMASARALWVDECMAQLAIDMGYVTADDPKDVRISMLSAEDAARLLNYYYTGSNNEFVTSDNARETQGYQDVFDASDDLGKFTVRLLAVRYPHHEGMNGFIVHQTTKIGDAQILTFPNGEIMLVDVGQDRTRTYLDMVRYYLESAKKAGIGDGKTIDYVMISHWHGDHFGNLSPVLQTFNVRNVIFPIHQKASLQGYVDEINLQNAERIASGEEPIKLIRVKRDDRMTIGEGDEAVDLHILSPGDNCVGNYSLEEIIRMYDTDKGGQELHNGASVAVKFTYKGQSYFTAGDIEEAAEVAMLRTFGAEVLKTDVMKLNHHGYNTSNLSALLNAMDADVYLQPNDQTNHYASAAVRYTRHNNTGGYAESVFSTAVSGSIKVALDGEKITSTTQFKERAYERDTDEYKNLETSYNALLERVEGTREALTVVADNASAPYGTAYIWNSHANYIDTQLEELSKRFYSGTMSIEMLEDYTDKLEALEQFIDDATMYGGTDTTPDVEVPGTDEGGETTTPGASGGIIGDVGGGNAGAGIGGGAVVVPEDPSVDDDRRFIDVATTDWFNNAVNYVADNNYFRGVSEKEFDPNGKMTRAMLVTVIGRMAKADTSEAVNNFTDVEDGSWYAGYVAWAAQNGIVTGVGDSKFAPNDNVTREQIAAILMRYGAYKGIDVSVSSTEKYDSMKDTDKVSEYAVEALKWATANAVINGAEGNINPRGNATRAEVAQMIMNFCNTFSI